MKNKFFLPLLGIVAMFIGSCEAFEEAANNSGTNKETVALGLKEALRVGTDTAVSILEVTDGYFKDQAVKILLPDDLENTISSFKSRSFRVLNTFTVTGEQLYNGYDNYGINVPSLKAKEEDLILGLNRAAEAAASSGGPIFVDAITSMTIVDAYDILYGTDTAATFYLKSKTYNNLYSNFEPKIDSVLNVVQVGGLSVAALYEDYIGTYNSVVTQSFDATTIGEEMNLNPIPGEDISAYATEKGLAGLFLKVSEEEKDIRENPLARVNDLLEEVFGMLD